MPEGTGSRGDQVLAARRESLERLRAAGVEPFALSLQQAIGVAEPDGIEDIRAQFQSLAPGETTDSVKTIAGRVAMVRDMGKLKFLVIRDRTGDLQLVCNEQDMNEPDVALLLHQLQLTLPSQPPPRLAAVSAQPLPRLKM